MPLPGCGKTSFVAENAPQRVKPRLISLHLRRGLKPRPFKSQHFSAACYDVLGNVQAMSARSLKLVCGCLVLVNRSYDKFRDQKIFRA